MSADDGTTDETATGAASTRPMLRIVRGNATAEEVAALVAVLAARATTATATEKPAPRRSEWARHERRMRRPMHPRPHGWRASAFAAGPL